MAVRRNEQEKLDNINDVVPNVTVFLRPIAPPAALGLAGFAGSTWITASWIAGWWGTPDSPGVFAPFVAFWGGLAQFIAGLMGYHARDALVTVIHCMWGAFWMSSGLLFELMTIGVLPKHGLHSHTSEIASWMVVLTVFTWSCAVASLARDLILCGVLSTLAIGSTIACCLFAYGGGVEVGMYVASYFWMTSALLAWYRVTVYLMDEAFGEKAAKFLPVFAMPTEKKKPISAPGFGEPGVQRAKLGAT